MDLTPEYPEEILDADAPPGTPRQTQAKPNLAPFWCRHGVKFDPTITGYVPETVDEQHPLTPLIEFGALPEVCHPASLFDPDERPDMVQRREAIERLMRAEGINPDGPLL